MKIVASQRAAAFMLLSVISFAAMNAGFKFLTAQYHPYQIVFLRGLASLPFALILLIATGPIQRCFTVDYRFQFLRSSAGIIGLLCFVYALANLSLMQAYSIALLAPLFVCLLSAALKREAASKIVWVATVIGFAGVLVIFRPSRHGLLSLAALASLAAAFCYAMLALLTRVVAQRDGSVPTFFWHSIFIIVGTALLAMSVWKTISLAHIPAILALGFVACVGQYSLILAFQHAAASRIANLEYCSIPIALLIDFLFWNTVADSYTIIGSVIIIVATLLIHYRDRHP